MKKIVRGITHNSSSTGVALISALLAISLVLMLVGTLLHSQNFHLGLVKFDKNRELGRQAASSLLEYSRFKLEEDQGWLGGDPLRLEAPSLADGTPLFEVVEIERADTGDGSFIVEATGHFFLPDEVPFHLRVVNNFASKENNHSLLPHTCLVEVEAGTDQSRTHYVSALRNAPFSQSTLAASGDIQIDTQYVVFSTTDPFRNQIRSKQRVHLPDVDRMTFEPGTNWQRKETGTVWAYQDILVGPEDEPLPLEEASELTGARFIPDGKSAYRVPDLLEEQVRALPEDSTVEMPSAEYRLGRRTVYFEDAGGTSHEAAVSTLMVDGTELYLTRDSLESVAASADFSTVRLHPDDLPITTHPTDSPEVAIGPGTFVLEQDLELPCALEFPTNLKIVAEEGFEIYGTSTQDLPLVEFVDPTYAVEPGKGHFEVVGDLTLACAIKNAGLLMATGDVNLQPSDIEVAANPAEDVAIYAGNDVNLDPSLVTPSGAFTLADGRKLAFRGLIYAGNDFKFDADSGLRTREGDRIDYNRELAVEGAVVAQGELSMRGPNGALLQYNPDFLNDVMEKTVRSNSKQLEVVYTREE